MPVNDHNTSRRSFLIKGSIASVGLLVAGPAAWSRSLLPGKPDSKFYGVQVGVITYSYRSMPADIHRLLQYVVDNGINAIELIGDQAEDYAGKPADKSQVAGWRAAASMDKFKEIKKNVQ